MATGVEAASFVSGVRPFLEANDLRGLVGLLQDRYTSDELAGMLSVADPDARKVAALCLGLVGTTATIRRLTKQLADHDPTVTQMAEHAIWSIWFRGGTPAANTELCYGAKALNARDIDRALAHFDRALALHPDFPEAYNQRAIARYMQEQYEGSIADCQQAVQLMPCHFGAWAGMGHSYLHLGQLREALRCYRKALSIHPHLDGVHQTADEIECRLAQQDA